MREADIVRIIHRHSALRGEKAHKIAKDVIALDSGNRVERLMKALAAYMDADPSNEVGHSETEIYKQASRAYFDDPEPDPHSIPPESDEEPPEPDMNADGPAERAHRDDEARRSK